MGGSIPYTFLGYTNFMSFIYYMPDMVSICRSRNNITLYSVVDERTKIKGLVSKQRSHKNWTSSDPPQMNMVTKNKCPSPMAQSALPLPDQAEGADAVSSQWHCSQVLQRGLCKAVPSLHRIPQLGV